MVLEMSISPSRLTRQPAVDEGRMAALEPMARLARQTGAVVHVVVARQPWAVERARAAAAASGVVARVDLMASTVRVRFSLD
jgi:hypothetical protein